MLIAPTIIFASTCSVFQSAQVPTISCCVFSGAGLGTQGLTMPALCILAPAAASPYCFTFGTYLVNVMQVHTLSSVLLRAAPLSAEMHS